MRLTRYITELIRVNSGHSSKAFFLVAVTLIGCVLLLCVAFVLIWEVMNSNTIHTDLMGLSAFVGSVAKNVRTKLNKNWRVSQRTNHHITMSKQKY